ncbi:dihydrofolate reductase family protein [Myxococcus stipitatus]|uniref:dihydrofolate reductase family protein n=1 Tax=Myxococcus stipitatus TaxID=83455 RepID=UPI003145049D
MGTLTLSLMTTLDGFITGPDNALDWVVWEEEMDRDATDLLQSVDTVLVGYGAYKDMAAYWPAALTSPSSESERIFARHFDEKPKVIVSDTPRELLWRNEELRVVTNLREEVQALKDSKGHLVCYGGAGFARSLVHTGLIDEYRFYVSPVAIGQGTRLFQSLTAPIKWGACTSKAYGSGAVLLHYKVAGPQQPR